MLLFPSLKNQLFGSRYQILYNNIDELKNSKVFRNSEIKILSIQEKPLENTYINRWTRVRGKIYIFSINLWNESPDSWFMTGYFNECEISYDMEIALKLDRLYELNQLDI